MPIFQLYWNPDERNNPKTPRSIWGCNDSIIVRAESEDRARFLASSAARDEGSDFWLDKKLSLCEIIEPDGDERIIVADLWGD